ncbi:MAG: YceH family protein [Opitutales bacterium]
MDPQEPTTLSLIETRILGCLLEKETATPDNYPLSLNALMGACNQKSNRNPVLLLETDEVEKGFESLRFKGLASVVSAAGSGVPKHRHKFENRFVVSPSEQAILIELLLRGPQSPGELRTRCERLHPFGSANAVEETLTLLVQRNCPLVQELPRQPGQKDNRFAQLISGATDFDLPAVSNEPLKVEVAVAIPPEAEARIASLEAAVAQLQEELASFKAQFD